jgi:hypothetical protein
MGMSTDRAAAMGALFQMNDLPALELVHWDPQFPQEFAMLIQSHGRPGNAYTDDQVIAVMRRLVKNGASPGQWQPGLFKQGQKAAFDAISDRVLCELARLSLEVSENAATEWLKVITRRISDRTPETPGRAELVGWIEKVLASDSVDLRRRALNALGYDDVSLCQPAIDARLEDSDSQCAAMAFTMLCAAGVAHGDAWLQRALKNQHAIVRSRAIERIATDIGAAAEARVLPFAKDESMAVRLEAAKYLGTVVSKAAVPDLIAMLKDRDETVRTAAAEALTRIRFFHEQQAHWDRVLKGLDASPASAAEKLLLQAKPGAAREQRLLALQSLGALGQPEALPFLIEWTQDKDTDLAAAARAATLQILQRSGVPAVK